MSKALLFFLSVPICLLSFISKQLSLSSTFDNYVSVAVICLITGSVLSTCLCLQHRLDDRLQKDRVYTSLTVLFALLVSAGVSATPLAAWDFMWLTGPEAKALIGQSVEDRNWFLDRTSSHSPLLPIIYALVAEQVRSLPSSATYLMTALGLCYLLLVLQVLITDCKGNGASLFIAVTLVVTCPLWENHLLMIGYSELIISAIWVTALVAGMNFMKSKSVMDGIFLLIVLSGLVSIKPSSAVMFVGILAALFEVYALESIQGKSKILIITICKIVGCAALIAVINIWWGTQELVIVGKEFVASGIDTASLLPTAVGALLMNTSFNVAFMASLFSMAALLSRRQLDTEVWILIAACINTLLIYILFAASDYGASTSGFGHDTSGSRLLLPAVLSMIALSALSLTTKEEDSRGHAD